MANESGFTAAERDAMKQRAAELRAEKSAATHADKRAKALEGVLEAIAALPEPDRLIAQGIHDLVTATAPELEPRLWYGMPAYARGKEVLCFVQPAAKFGARYATFGFNDAAALDEGALWPTAFAVVHLDPETIANLTEVVRRAVAHDPKAEG